MVITVWLRKRSMEGLKAISDWSISTGNILSIPYQTLSLFGLWGEQMGGKVIKIKIKKWSQTHPFGAVFYTKVCVNQAKIKCLNRKRDWVTRWVCEERGRWLTTNWIVELSESDRWRLTRTTRLLQKDEHFQQLAVNRLSYRLLDYSYSTL